MKKKIALFLCVFTLMPQVGLANLHDPTMPQDFVQSKTGKLVTNFSLNAIIYSLQRKVAVINGDAFVLGSKLGDKSLIAINPDSVQLQGPGGKITLLLVNEKIKQAAKPQYSQ